MNGLLQIIAREYTLAGVAVGAALLLVVRTLLPKEHRGRIKIAGVYLVLALFAGAVLHFVDPHGSSTKTIDFFYWFFVLASCGRSLVLLVVDVLFGRKTHQTAPRIFRDLTQAVVYVIVVMITLREVGVEPGSLLTTSALLTAVVGLALQDTLGNLVSGLALQMQRPFQVGDWIQFDTEPRNIGQVTEVNWRATTVMTTDLVELIIPNAALAKAAIRNYSRPSTVSRRSITVSGPYEVPPHRVQDAIVKVLETAPGVIPEPAPWVQTRNFGDSGVEYTVFFFTDDFAAREQTDGIVRDRVWYALHRAGVVIPFPIRTVHMHQISEETERRARERELARRDEILRCVEFLDALPAEAHRHLASAAEVRLFAPGEIIVRQGDEAGELFVIDRGEVEVEIKGPGKRNQLAVARLGPGKFFGEMALMTGEPRKATVRAATECALIVVGHDAFHETIASVPEVLGKLSHLLAERALELEAIADGSRPSLEVTPQESQRLLGQIKAFFKL